MLKKSPDAFSSRTILKTEARLQTLPLFEATRRLALPGAEQNLFSSLAWQHVLQRTYGLKLFCKFIEEEGILQSYFIYSVVHNFLEWKVCVGSYCDYLDN